MSGAHIHGKVKPVGVVAVGAGVLTICLLLFGAWIFYGIPHSDPPNDFKRFVMGGPHWPDEDKAQRYKPSDVPLPKSVQVLKSARFSALMEEGAVLHFKIDQEDVDRLLAMDDFEPTTDSNEKERLDKLSGRYLWISSNDLGPSPSFYITKISYPNVIRALMAVNRERNRAIFLHVNFN